MPINMRYGPDGNVYLIDWYDKQTCHNNDAQIWDRSNGRIYKICYKPRGEVLRTPWVGVDLSKKTNKELVKLQLHNNDWYVRHARRILQERFAIREYDETTEAIRNDLLVMLEKHKDERRRIRALRALNAIGQVNNLVAGLTAKDSSEHVRAWSLRLLFERDLTLYTPLLLGRGAR